VDGGHFTLRLHLMPGPARTPGLVCFVILGRDITAALQAKQLQESTRRLLAKVFVSVDIAVAIVDGAGRIVMANPRTDLLLGYKPAGIVGRKAADLEAPDPRAATATLIEKQFKDGKDATYTVPLLRADGSQLIVRCTSVIATPRSDATAPVATRGEGVGHIKLVGLEEIRSALFARSRSARCSHEACRSCDQTKAGLFAACTVRLQMVWFMCGRYRPPRCRSGPVG
jgi:PAS domain S-box-containing protein